MKHFYIQLFKKKKGSLSFSLLSPSVPSVFFTYLVPPTVRIGAMLAYTPLDEKSLALLLGYLQDFLKWDLTPAKPPQKDPLSCLANSQMSCHINISTSAARLVANPQNTSREMDFLLWKIFVPWVTVCSQQPFYDGLIWHLAVLF